MSHEKWSNPLEFFLSCIALSVGLGNVWRFPATALANGGGAFLIPYLCVLTFIGRPLYYLELCIGQFTSLGNVKIWNMSPAMKGIGYSQMTCTALVVSYYVAMMAITLSYFIASFSRVLPWSVCPVNSTDCLDHSTAFNSSNNTRFGDVITAAERYYKYEVVKTHPGGFDDGIFAPDWRLSIFLFFSWVVVFVVLSKGVQSSGKAAYFMALFPYVVLFILLVRGLTLPGAIDGVKYFFTPQWEKLLDPTVWKAAVGQCFFSLSVCFGPVIIMASFNDFRHNVYRDALIISLVDTFTSILAGCITFSIMGYLAHEIGTDDLQSVIKDGGLGLAFISYADVIGRFPWCPQFFAAIFFLMLFTLGTGSATGMWNVVITVICDHFAFYDRTKITLVTCIFGFLSGLIYITPQGQYVVTIVDLYATDTGAYIVGIVEILAIQYIYGFNRVLRDIKFMLKRETGIYWRICWSVVTPASLIIILIYSFVESKPLTLGSYQFKPVAKGVAILIAVLTVALIPIFLLYAIFKHDGNNLADVFKPSPKWGPATKQHKEEYDDFVKKEEKTTTLSRHFSPAISNVTLVSISTISDNYN